MTLRFYIVDVFSEQKYAGNQLAVFRDAKNLSTLEMQRLAKEINYSETTFITSEVPENGGYSVRIFTPEQELPFAGHPTLGTAFILQQEIIQQPVETVILNLQVGQIPVTLNYGSNGIDILWMRQNAPVFGQQFDRAAIAPLLNLSPEQIDEATIEEVSTGVPFIIVPLKTQAALKQAKVNKEQFFKLMETTEAKAILVFCPETYNSENQLSVRVFADGLGIPEDPATGSANGCLAGYLVQHNYFGEASISALRNSAGIDLRVEQGYEIGRPSLLLLRAEKKTDAIQVEVGGKVILIARGEFV